MKWVTLRVCASCEWIFSNNDPTCPKCGFGSYGAHRVYGRDVYRYKKTQKPWKDKKMEKYLGKLEDNIRGRT